ncbi:MAG: hypothetical protein OCD00_08265 [Colwellia sp.]
MIHKYENNVFTHGGQTSVAGFGEEIMAMQADIAAVEGLVVYAGYHGDLVGDWDHDFTSAELVTTDGIATAFPNIQLVLVQNPGLSDDEIRVAVEKGNVFFTWCDSDAKIKAVMGWP